MRLAEAASRETASVARVAEANLAASGADGASDPFAAILAATRRSPRSAMDLLMPRPDVESDARRQEAKTASATARQDRPRDDKPARDSADKPGRAEQLRTMHDQRQARSAATASQDVQPREAATDPTASAPDRSAQTRTDDSALHGLPTGAGDVSGLPLDASAVSAAPAASGAQPGTESSHAANGTLHAEAHRADRPAQAGAAGTMSAGVTAAGAPAEVPSSNGLSSGTASGREAPAPAAVRAAAPARSGGTGGSEFQNLLQTLGRSRSAEPAPATGAASGFASGRATSTGETPEKSLELRSTESLRELARIVQSRAGLRDGSMTLRLSPAELGRLRIDVRMVEQMLEVRFEAQTPEGARAIQGKLNELKVALEQQGVQVDRIEVQLAPRSPASLAGGEHQGQGQAQPDDRGPAADPDGQYGPFGQHAGQARQSFAEQRDVPADLGGATELGSAHESAAVRPAASLDQDLQSRMDIMA